VSSRGDDRNIYEARNAGGRIAMAQSFTNLVYHIVFSTKNRRPLIAAERKGRLYEYIGGTVRGLGGILLAINGTADHIHILVKLRPDKALSFVLRDLKSNASGWMHDVFPDARDFEWQRGLRCVYGQRVTN